MGEKGAVPAAVSSEVARPVPGRSRRQMRRRRVFVGDERDDGRYLRMTWHREKGVFVLSTWAGDVCTGSVRVPVEQAPELISLLVDGLGDAVARPQAGVPDERPAEPGLVGRLVARLEALRPSKRRRSKPSTGQATSATILKLR